MNAARILMARLIADTFHLASRLLLLLSLGLSTVGMILVLWLLPEDEANEIRKEIENGRA
jgi:hypothetical protein